MTEQSNPSDIREKTQNPPSREDLKWEFLDIKEFTEDSLKYFSVIEVRKMFLRTQAPMVPELAYLSFIQHSTWGMTFNIEHGIQRILMQLRLPLFEGKGLSWREMLLNPNKIWATEDSLDEDILSMVRVGVNYMDLHNKPMPPIAVWLIRNEGRYNWVCHDGHHRIYLFANELKRKIPAVVMEYWIDNQENPLLSQKLHYRQINKCVKDLDVVKRV